MQKNKRVVLINRTYVISTTRLYNYNNIFEKYISIVIFTKKYGIYNAQNNQKFFYTITLVKKLWYN